MKTLSKISIFSSYVRSVLPLVSSETSILKGIKRKLSNSVIRFSVYFSHWKKMVDTLNYTQDQLQYGICVKPS